MRVIGIDPGSAATGFAVVDRKGNQFSLVEAGTIRTSSKDPMAHRLGVIHQGIANAIAGFGPDQCAIECIFKHRSAESALRLGHARGAAMVAAAQAGLMVSEYNPMTIKMSVAGHGRADKSQVQQMVRRLLGTQVKLSADASDACAIAITHLVRYRMEMRMVAR